jgi:hypothetical protein
VKIRDAAAALGLERFAELLLLPSESPSRFFCRAYGLTRTTPEDGLLLLMLFETHGDVLDAAPDPT